MYSLTHILTYLFTLKALSPMVVRVAGKVSLRRAVHEKKAASPIVWRAAGRLSSTRAEQPG